MQAIARAKPKRVPLTALIVVIDAVIVVIDGDVVVVVVFDCTFRLRFLIRFSIWLILCMCACAFNGRNRIRYDC